MSTGLSAARDALIWVLDYVNHREVKFVSLGALIPSIAWQGRPLKQPGPTMAITTDHGFTAVAITQMVDHIEEEIGASGVVAVDDAQLENIDRSVLVARPDLRVVKCLTRIPELHGPFEMGLFTPVNRDDEVNFTCLPEISLSAAEQHPASCVVGDPTDKQLDYLAEAARRHGVRPAEFFSFPEVGGISLQPPRP